MHPCHTKRGHVHTLTWVPRCLAVSVLHTRTRKPRGVQSRIQFRVHAASLPPVGGGLLSAPRVAQPPPPSLSHWRTNGGTLPPPPGRQFKLPGGPPVLPGLGRAVARTAPLLQPFALTWHLLLWKHLAQPRPPTPGNGASLMPGAVGSTSLRGWHPFPRGQGAIGPVC